jgi:hypothetical protein
MKQGRVDGARHFRDTNGGASVLASRKEDEMPETGSRGDARPTYFLKYSSSMFQVTR